MNIRKREAIYTAVARRRALLKKEGLNIPWERINQPPNPWSGQEECQGREDCDHLCRDVCPQVKAGEPTLTVQDDGKAYIDPASCGCCGLCISGCPYGCIEMVEEKMDF